MKAIRSYSYKPSPNFTGKGRKKNPRYFGVELETYPAKNTYAGREYALNRLAEYEANLGFAPDSFVYCKSDSSLYEGFGFEIVTHPFTRDWMYRNRVFAGLAKCSLSSLPYDSTGIHVHVNKASMSVTTIAKLLYFFSLEKTDELLTKVGQRQWNRYCQKPVKGSAKEYIKDRGRWASRYCALNVTGEHTIEFRFFKGNAAPEALYRAVEFCDAIVNYCTSTTVNKLCPVAFAEYVKTERRESNKKSRSFKYPYLRKHLSK